MAATPPHTVAEAAARGRCADCGGEFDHAVTFYTSRGLVPPKRCRSCRYDRRIRRVPIFGTVSGSGQFAFLDGDDGITYFAPEPPPDLARGDSVRFTTDPCGSLGQDGGRWPSMRLEVVGRRIPGPPALPRPA